MSKNSEIPGKTPPQVFRANAAVVREALRGQRTPQEQLAELDSRPGASTKERKRLQKVIDSE